KICGGSCLTNQHYVVMIDYRVLIEIAASQAENAEGLEITRSDIVALCCGTLIHRQNFSVRAGVKHVTGGGGNQRDVAADRRALKTWNCIQRGQRSFHETLPCGGIGIWRLR